MGSDRGASTGSSGAGEANQETLTHLNRLDSEVKTIKMFKDVGPS